MTEEMFRFSIAGEPTVADAQPQPGSDLIIPNTDAPKQPEGFSPLQSDAYKGTAAKYAASGMPGGDVSFASPYPQANPIDQVAYTLAPVNVAAIANSATAISRILNSGPVRPYYDDAVQSIVSKTAIDHEYDLGEEPSGFTVTPRNGRAPRGCSDCSGGQQRSLKSGGCASAARPMGLFGGLFSGGFLAGLLSFLGGGGGGGWGGGDEEELNPNDDKKPPDELVDGDKKPPPKPGPTPPDGDKKPNSLTNPAAAAFAELVKERRKKLGLPPVVVDTSMAGPAEENNKIMNERTHASGHNVPVKPNTSEIAFYGPKSAKGAMQGFLDSPPHRAAIEDPHATRMYIAQDGKAWTAVFA